MDLSTQPGACHQRQRRHAAWIREGKLHGGQTSQGVAGHGGAADFERIEEAADEFAEHRQGVTRRRPVRAAGAGKIRRNHPESPGQFRQYPPPGVRALAAAMEQHERRAGARGEVMDPRTAEFDDSILNQDLIGHSNCRPASSLLQRAMNSACSAAFMPRSSTSSTAA